MLHTRFGEDASEGASTVIKEDCVVVAIVRQEHLGLACGNNVEVGVDFFCQDLHGALTERVDKWEGQCSVAEDGWVVLEGAVEGHDTAQTLEKGARDAPMGMPIDLVRGAGRTLVATTIIRLRGKGRGIGDEVPQLSALKGILGGPSRTPFAEVLAFTTGVYTAGVNRR
jgi:hypothetical protein